MDGRSHRWGRRVDGLRHHNRIHNDSISSNHSRNREKHHHRSSSSSSSTSTSTSTSSTASSSNHAKAAAAAAVVVMRDGRRPLPPLPLLQALLAAAMVTVAS